MPAEVPVPPGDQTTAAREEVRRLSAEEADAALNVLVDAFSDYPVMRYVLGPGPDYEKRLRVLIGFFLRARVERAEPILGFLRDGRLEGVALLSNPNGPPSPPALAVAREQVWSALGAEERGRYEAFGAVSLPLLASRPRLHLNMIGVRKAAGGAGIGRRLLDEVHRTASFSPGIEGVSLSTEAESNLRFYHSAGYAITGEAVVSPTLRTWAMFRPIQSVVVPEPSPSRA